MEFWRKNRLFLILALIGVAMFFVYSYLPLSQINWQKENNVNLSLRFNTPDEVLNYYFSNQYARSGELFYFEPWDKIMNQVVFPRWALVIENKITPGNFLGLDLIYGAIGKAVNLISDLKVGVTERTLAEIIIPFLTPFFAVICALFFYLLIKIFFDKKVAFVSALLMLIFPGFWYYSSRTMFNNVLFLSLLIAGLYFLINFFHTNLHKYEHKKTQIRNFILSALAGLFFGLALITRTSEIIWVALIVLVILFFYRKNLKNLWPYFLISAVIFCACFVPVLYHNKILYNNYFSTGYPLTTVSSNLETGQVNKIGIWQAVFLPFGFHLKNIILVVYNYIFKLFWPWAVLVLVGLFVFIKNKKTNEQKLFFSLSLVTYYLLLYYGSWVFHDSPIQNLISIGSSYVRYFLPIYIFSLPFIALLLVKIWQSQRIKLLFKFFLFIIFFHYTLYLIHNTIFSGPESLPAIKNNLIKYNIQARSILEIVDKDDIILLDMSADKIVFPELKHIIVPQNNVEYPEIRKAFSFLPKQNFYYFHNNASISADWLNKNKFNFENLEIYAGQNMEGGGVVYKIKLED